MGKMLSTDYCYECLNTKENVFEIGGYNDFDEPDFDKTTLEFSQSAWEDEKEYFMSFLKSAISEHEKRYRTAIVRISLTGRVGLWNGSPVGGRMLSLEDNPLSYMGDVDSIDVKVMEDGIIQLHGHHHDGTHRMNLYLLSNPMLKRINPAWNESGFDFSYEDFEAIYAQCKPLKLTKSGREFYNPKPDS